MSLSLSALLLSATLLSTLLKPSSASKALVSEVVLIANSKLVGYGGFGSVFEIKVEENTFALKVPHNHTNQQQLYEEAEMLDTLRSNLTEEEQPYFALVPPGFRNPVDVKYTDKLFRGIVLPLYQKSLFDYLFQYEPGWFWPDPEAVRLSIQIARSLRALHRLGIVHSDLKPANILLNLTGSEITLALTDFGGAVHQGEKIKAMTEFYTAPEYLDEGELASARATAKLDVYSFGVVLRQLIAGESLGTLMQEPDDASYAQKDQPLISRCLHLDPRERPTVDDIIEELTEIERAIPAYKRCFWLKICLGFFASFIVISTASWCCLRRRRHQACMVAMYSTSSKSLEATAVIT